MFKTIRAALKSLFPQTQPYYGFDITPWKLNATIIKRFSIKQVGKHGLIKDYELIIAFLDRKNMMGYFRGGSKPRKVSTHIKFKSALSKQDLAEIFSNCDEIGVVASKRWIKVRKDSMWKIINFTLIDSWSNRYTRGNLDFCLATDANALLFVERVPCTFAL